MHPKIKPKPSQAAFTKKLFQRDVFEILFAGTAGTGKTYWAAIMVVGLCHDFPGTRWGVFRKELSTARKTVWQTYIKILNELNIPYRSIRGHEPTIYFDGYDSRIEFFGLDESKDADFMKAKGLELSGAHVDEANEIDLKGINVLKSRIGRWNSENVPAKMIYTCNPSQGWVRTDFREPFKNGALRPDRAFVESNASELEPGYRAILESLPEKERQRYLENNWDYSEDPDQLIKYEWIKSSPAEEIKRATDFGVDFARSRDKSILAYRYRSAEVDEINHLEDVQISPNQTIATAEILVERLKEYGVESTRMRGDVVGIGGGPIDYMKAQGFNITEYNGGLAADVKETAITVGGKTKKVLSALQFRNKRTQDHWLLREALRTGRLKVVQDPELIKQATAVRYSVNDKVIQVEPKKDIIKRLGHSPDKLDACIMAYSQINKSKFSFVI